MNIQLAISHSRDLAYGAPMHPLGRNPFVRSAVTVLAVLAAPDEVREKEVMACVVARHPEDIATEAELTMMIERLREAVDAAIVSC